MDVVIVGAGQAGVQVALSLRQKGHTGGILLIGGESHLPYQRPPLSKAFLKGEVGAESLLFRTAEALASQAIELRLGATVRRIDRAAKTVVLDGGALRYDRLVLTTGTRPRRLTIPGASLPGVAALRSLTDAEDLRRAISAAERIVIVGGGFIGLEVAATVRAAGKTVTVLEAADRVMKRAVAPEISAFFEALHRRMGTTVLTGATVAGLSGDGRVETVTLGDGTVLAADLVLVGVGAEPNVEIAAEAGLSCPNGIAVDDHGRTADPDVFAAGDCTWHPNPFAGGGFRLESVQNAIDQAKTVAAAILGEEAPYEAVPWFWSDQGDAKLQTTGLPIGTDARVLRGDPEAGKFTVFHLRDGVLIAADSVNAPADHMAARRLVAARAVIPPAVLADAGTPLKSLLS
jgi:3-phenylpropionate/trans-cinnamate dioxygenase ferredoxin reductase subunit